MKISEDRRIGKIEMSRQMLFDDCTLKQLKNIFKEFIVLNCEYDMVWEKITYTMYCEVFDKIELDEEVPYYDMKIQSDEKKNVNVVDIKRRKL